MRRITFNEITKTAVKASLKEARSIDMNLVDEQQARRCLDRMVGYEISPLLWKKIKRGLSAGRVQSVALRIIGDREDEINAFIPREYWDSGRGIPDPRGEEASDSAFLRKRKGKNQSGFRETAGRNFERTGGMQLFCAELKKGERRRKAPQPFTTSTMQQEAAKVLNFSTQKTMRLAQQLYEGIEIKGNGTVGLISYLRTDSTRISEEADTAAREYIREQYGEQFASRNNTTGNQNRKAQDAHEAIRPTDVSRTPAAMKDSLSRDQFRLYQLIWKRFVASRMEAAVYETISAVIRGGGYDFHASASRVKFEGFMTVYTEEDERKKGQLCTAAQPG